MRVRDLLHKTHLNAFRQWLEKRGYVNQTPKGDYEVLRMRHVDDQHPLLVYDRIDAPEHYTTHGVAYRMATEFYRQRRAERKLLADAGHATTPGMWRMVSDALDGELLPESINSALRGLCIGELRVISQRELHDEHNPQH